jgi:RNA polymerase sigma-70 factor (ECF subfamily)
MASEQALIDAAQQGSADAFAELVRGYREGLLRFLLTRSASFADAEDVLQDTLINAYRYIGSYDARWRFSTWLYRIAINNAARLRTAASVELGEVGDEGSDPLEQCISAVLERSISWTKVNLMRGRKALDGALNPAAKDQKSQAYG